MPLASRLVEFRDFFHELPVYRCPWSLSPSATIPETVSFAGDPLGY